MPDGIFRNKEKFVKSMIKILLIPLSLVIVVWLVRLICVAVSAHNGGGAEFWYPQLFSDFTQVAYYSVRKEAYLLEGGSSYSAVALLFMLPFALIFKKDLDTVEYSVNWAQPNMTLLSSPRFWTAFLLYQVAMYAVTYFLIGRLAKRAGISQRSAFVFFASSAGVIYILIRGNTLLMPLSLILIFLELYAGEKVWKRELAIVSLAVAGAFKLYPLFFCAFLLHDKKWFATFRMFLYFAAFYFLPVIFYEGGLSAYLSNLFVFIGGENHLLDRSNIAFASTLYKIAHCGTELFHGTLPAWTDKLCMTAGILALIAFAVAAVVTEDTFKRSVLSLCAVTLVPPVSYFYVVIFALVPAAEYLKSYETRSESANKLFFVCCIVLAFYPIYAFKWFAVCAVALVAIGAVTVCKVFKDGDFGIYMSQVVKKIRKDGENV